MAAELKALDIFKLLPGTNCKKCGEPTCLAFAVKLVGRDIEITKCDPLFSEKYQEKAKGVDRTPSSCRTRNPKRALGF